MTAIEIFRFNSKTRRVERLFAKFYFLGKKISRLELKQRRIAEIKQRQLVDLKESL